MTERPVLIGLLDSGVGKAFAPLEAQRAFHGAVNGSVTESEAQPDRLNHGSVIARSIAEMVPDARFAAAQIFHDRMATTATVAAAGLDWLREEGARLVTMSFGLARDRDILRAACVRAHEAGCILLASSPARGGPVYPAAYENVIAVSGDARLGPGEVSALGTPQADFGAYAWPAGLDEEGRPLAGGASFAVTTAAAVVAHYVRDNPDAGRSDILQFLRESSRYHGPERRK